MRELSLNILDIAQNSISAGASLITIDVSESRKEHLLTLTVSDNGCGMDEEQLANIMDRMYSLIRGKYINAGHLSVIGPSEPAISKIKDVYRRVLYIKHRDYRMLVDVKDYVEEWLKENGENDVSVFFDLNPVNMY